MYQSQSIENALSMHKMGFETSCLAYIMRGLYDILLENNSNYIFFIHDFFDDPTRSWINRASSFNPISNWLEVILDLMATRTPPPHAGDI